MCINNIMQIKEYWKKLVNRIEGVVIIYNI